MPRLLVEVYIIIEVIATTLREKKEEMKERKKKKKSDAIYKQTRIYMYVRTLCIPFYAPRTRRRPRSFTLLAFRYYYIGRWVYKSNSRKKVK